MGESVNTTKNSTEGEDKCENGEDEDYVCEDIEQGTWQLLKYTSDSIQKDHDDLDDGWEIL